MVRSEGRIAKSEWCPMRLLPALFIMLIGMGSAASVWAQHGGGRRAVSLTRPVRQGAPMDQDVARRAAQRRAATRRWKAAANPAVAANEADSLALVALFDSTGGVAWMINTNWLTGPVAGWVGVTLNEQGRVTEVDLRENNLAGPIPDELADLTELEGLLLAGNQLRGPIPEAVTTLPRLKTLSLWGNALTGSIPPALGQQTELEDLLLFGNQFTGSIPPELGGLPRLDRLWLDFNQLTGPIPPALADLSTLTELFLDFNQLTGTIPTELTRLTNVLSLFLGNNQLTGEIPEELGTMTTVENLSLANNAHTGSIPLALTGMTNLSTLFLGGNQLTGEIPEELANLANLTRLYLNGNQLTGEIPESLGFIRNLRELDLHGNALTGEIPPPLGFLGILAYLNLSDNQLTGALPDNMQFMQRLERLDLSGNQLTGPVTLLVGLPRLAEVYLRGNAFTGAAPEALAFLPLLRVIDLAENRLGGSIPSLWSRLANLERLDLDGNQIEGAVPLSFNELSALRRLLLNDNRLDTMPDLSMLAMLDTVNVANNRLTFEDLEPNVSLADGAIIYAPQDTVETRLRRTAAQVTFSVSVGGAENQYQWFRDGTAIEGASADTLSVEAAAAVATYHCEITNTVATALTLMSRPLRSDAVPTGLDTAPDETALTTPESFALHANYPNPFNASTRLAFDVAAPAQIRLTIYDALGRTVATPVDRWMPAGRYRIPFDAGDLPSGLYLYQIEMEDYRASRTMLLIR